MRRRNYHHPHDHHHDNLRGPKGHGRAPRPTRRRRHRDPGPPRRAADARLRADRGARGAQRRPLEAECRLHLPRPSAPRSTAASSVATAMTTTARTASSSPNRAVSALAEQRGDGHGSVGRRREPRPPRRTPPRISELVGPCKQIGRFGSTDQVDAAVVALKEATAQALPHPGRRLDGNRASLTSTVCVLTAGTSSVSRVGLGR